MEQLELQLVNCYNDKELNDKIYGAAQLLLQVLMIAKVKDENKDTFDDTIKDTFDDMIKDTFKDFKPFAYWNAARLKNVQDQDKFMYHHIVSRKYNEARDYVVQKYKEPRVQLEFENTDKYFQAMNLYEAVRYKSKNAFLTPYEWHETDDVPAEYAEYNEFMRCNF